ncbi:acylphosphatase [Oceanobacillus sojae]|uniref:acylphosphatase n=1 Tax=Oceanobacillus sojae TaxID=582851 RepID=UPI0021A44660|nr:acylphosphatase [Oceanobacillus sojae]MCT1905528.1 acylphosphatase [Oceanobacillus sojae]
MVFQEVELFPKLTKEVVKDITGFQLCSYLVALEGWRRGLELKWYRDETNRCKLDRMNGTTHGRFFSLSNGDKTHYFFRSRGDKVANKTVKICQDKEKTKSYLQQSHVPIPLGATLETNEDIINYANKIGYPVIIKPLSGSMGKGVYTNISNKEELVDILKELRSAYSYRKYLVEKHYDGKEYRVYVVGDKVIGATNRIPANIIGDGVNTVEKLINIKNKERKLNPYLAPKPIKADYEVTYMLERVGYTLDSIPETDEQVFLREKSNLSSGGDPIEATDELSEEVKQIAVNALQALPSIPHAGVDIIVDPQDGRKGVVLEANATAEIGFHLFPLEGKARDVSGAIIDYYFPETIEAKKSNFYFDYPSLLEPLKNFSVDEIKVGPTPLHDMFVKKYTATGSLNRVGYLTYIKRQALKRNIFGYVKKLDKNKVEIYLVGKEQEVLNTFKEVVKRGSKKSSVEQVEEEDLAYSNEPAKMEFQLIK